MRKVFWFFVSLCCFSVDAQVKYEKETRVSVGKVPKLAVQTTAEFLFPKKVKWFKETQLHAISFEAKTKKNKRVYSVEFSSEGVLEDIEIGVPWRILSVPVKEKISVYLKKAHGKYRVLKVQEQYTGSKKALVLWIREGKQKSHVRLRYELVVRTKQQQIEYLFDQKGNFLKKAVFVEQASDHLEF